jgi:flagellar motor switch protein FliG
MTRLNSNLRKAAIFIRSLDAETAAKMLAELSPDEAAALRDAVRAVGPIDPEEQADVIAEFRSARPVAAELAGAGVELALTSAADPTESAPFAAAELVPQSSRPFEFLEKAPIDALIPYLAREHVQTIALVLSHLAPPRAAAVIAALPDKLQAETLERLAAIGETDPDSVVVVERELATWLARRATCRPGDVRRNDTVAAILASTDALTRSQIVANLRMQKSELANQLGPVEPPRPRSMERKSRSTEFSHQAAACAKRLASGIPAHTIPRPVPVRDREWDREKTLSTPPHVAPAPPVPRRPAAVAPPRSAAASIASFDDLIHMDARTLAAVLREINVEVLVLALAGSHEKLMHRVCDQVPKRVARTLRRQLRQLGPTRLSDIEEAQRAVSLVAAKHAVAFDSRRMAAVAS